MDPDGVHVGVGSRFTNHVGESSAGDDENGLTQAVRAMKTVIATFIRLDSLSTLAAEHCVAETVEAFRPNHTGPL